jgi:uncharacterized heparinase superfamily protein
LLGALCGGKFSRNCSAVVQVLGKTLPLRQQQQQQQQQQQKKRNFLEAAAAQEVGQ